MIGTRTKILIEDNNRNYKYFTERNDIKLNIF